MVLEKDKKTQLGRKKRKEDILRKMDTWRNLMAELKMKKRSLFRHIIQHNDFMKNNLEGKIIEEKRKEEDHE